MFEKNRIFRKLITLKDKQVCSSLPCSLFALVSAPLFTAFLDAPLFPALLLLSSL